MEERGPSHAVGGNVNWCSWYGKQYGGSLKNWKRVTVWSSNSPSQQISGKHKNSNSKIYMHPSFHNFSIYNSQGMSMDRWMDKDMMYPHTHTEEYYSAIKRMK